MKQMKERWAEFQEENEAVSSWALVIVCLLIAYIFCWMIMQYTMIDNDAPVVFLMAVVIISRLTRKYRYGIFTSLASSFAINFFFTYPYNYFTLMVAGYPIDFLCMTAVSMMISTMTTQENEAVRRALLHEKETIALYKENKALEEKQARVKLEAAKEKMYSNLLRAVSHDLRTPLTSVAGASAVLVESGEQLSPEERKNLAGDIHGEALWLTQMVENLLSVTRINNGDEIHLNKRSEIVDEVLEESIIKFKKRFPDQDVSVKAPEEILLVPMDAMLIEQVLINLYENAVRHSGVQTPIDVAADREGNYVFFRVRDYGRGIPEEEMPHLFSGNLNLSDSTRGMGIGLSVCTSIIESHNGTLSAENKDGGGVEFCFFLPIDSDANEKATQLQEE